MHIHPLHGVAAIGNFNFESRTFSVHLHVSYDPFAMVTLFP